MEFDMDYLVVELVSQTASFRDPGFQNFHKTLELPPPTTIVGMTGAALGLSPLKSQKFFMLNKIKVGVYGKYRGKCSDTWKYSKRTKDMWLYKTENDSSIVQREYLIHNFFLISFSAEPEIIEKLEQAFQNPVYAITFGNSDSLAKVIQVDRREFAIDESNEIEHTIIEGNVIDNVMRLAPEKLEFSIYQTAEPIAYDLPVAFDYESDYGKRTVARVKTYSIIGKMMKLNYSVKGLRYHNVFIPLINLQ